MVDTSLPLLHEFMSNKETFITTIIHSLQEFHIHYGMYVVAKMFEIHFLFFYLFYRTCLFKKEII